MQVIQCSVYTRKKMLFQFFSIVPLDLRGWEAEGQYEQKLPRVKNICIFPLEFRVLVHLYWYTFWWACWGEQET